VCIPARRFFIVILDRVACEEGKMLTRLIFVLILACAGCATTVNQPNLSVSCPNGGSIEKKDYAPPDFPNEIFAEYSCKRSIPYHFDLNSDGINDIVWNAYFDNNDKAEAWWVLKILEDDRTKATTWAFLKNINGVATIIWENKRLKKEQREWLNGIIKSINEALATQSK
jgi:hypothetical protein